MNKYTEREDQIKLLKKSFSIELSRFREHLREELTSLLAFAINEASNGKRQKCFAKAISHITSQKGFMSYSSLSKAERLCVNIFAEQVISKQEHIVFYSKNYMDTLRISDANAKKCETAIVVNKSCACGGFISGFVSISKKLGLAVNSMVSANTGGKREN